MFGKNPDESSMLPPRPCRRDVEAHGDAVGPDLPAVLAAQDHPLGGASAVQVVQGRDAFDGAVEV